MMEKEDEIKLNNYLKKKLKKSRKKHGYKEDSKERCPRIDIPQYISWHDLRFFDFPFPFFLLTLHPMAPLQPKRKT